MMNHDFSHPRQQEQQQQESSEDAVTSRVSATSATTATGAAATSAATMTMQEQRRESMNEVSSSVLSASSATPSNICNASSCAVSISVVISPSSLTVYNTVPDLLYAMIILYSTLNIMSVRVYSISTGRWEPSKIEKTVGMNVYYSRVNNAKVENCVLSHTSLFYLGVCQLLLLCSE